MEKVIINSYEEFEKLVGQQIGVSDYVELSQERINLFADATLDHQWIHVDTERAKVDSPYHSTIAHGYLTLSMLPYLWNQIIQVNNLKMMINYGMDKMKFGQAVLSGQSIRLVTTLHSLTSKTSPKRLLKELPYSCTISIDLIHNDIREKLFSVAGDSFLFFCSLFFCFHRL